MSDLLGRTWTRDRNAIVQFALNGHRLENRIQLHAKMTFGETFGAAAVAGYAGPGFHNWPPSHIPQDTDTNPLRRIRSPLKKHSEARDYAAFLQNAGFFFRRLPRVYTLGWYSMPRQGMRFETRWTNRVSEPRSEHGIGNDIILFAPTGQRIPAQGSRASSRQNRTARTMFTDLKCPRRGGSSCFQSFALRTIRLIGHDVLFDPQVTNDKLLSVWGVFPHVKRQEFFDGRMGVEADRIEPDIRSDESGKFIRTNFAEPFKPGDFDRFPTFFDGL